MSTTLLDDVFQECIISMSLWPPHRPDLNPLDYFFCSAAKKIVQHDRPLKVQLKAEITGSYKIFHKTGCLKCLKMNLKHVHVLVLTYSALKNKGVTLHL